MTDDVVHEMLAKAAERGRLIPGGCDNCNAYQTLDQIEDGVWSLIVHHDDWCPFLRARTAEAN